MSTDTPRLAAAPGSSQVWRVGYRPEPWAWPSWQYATHGRFPGRWDDAEGNFRTIYAGTQLLSCLLEVLACFRPDPELAAQMTDILQNDNNDDNDDAGTYPTAPTGTVPHSWLEPRAAASATLTGAYASITHAESVAALRPMFLHRAQQLGLDDFDTAALKNAKPRALTQEVATYVYATTDLDGVQFLSRHGDDHVLWAIFERPGDPDTSPDLHNPARQDLTPHTTEILEALRIHRLAWADDSPTAASTGE